MAKKIVVVGMGYVGIPVAALFAKAGCETVGLDIVKEKVASLNRGEYPLEGVEPGMPELVKEVTESGGFRASADPSVCRNADGIFFCVQTPVDEVSHEPHYKALKAACRSVGENLTKGTVVVVESTISPGTMRDMVQPTLEEASGLKAGKDFYLVHCPERVMPGRLLYNLDNYVRVLGGVDRESAEKALELYRLILKVEIDLTDMLTAEIVKTTENAYRDTQIAFANQIALLCETMGADVFEVRTLVNKCPFRDMHIPGAGVGGHCIPKDPWLLAYAVRPEKAEMIEVSRRINDSMPVHTAQLALEGLKAIGVRVEGARAGVLGASYLPDSDDTRLSPTVPLLSVLEESGVQVKVHDPYVKVLDGREIFSDLSKVVEGADVLIAMAAHKDYFDLDWDGIGKVMAHPLVVDGRNLLSKEEAEASGFRYVGLGKPRPDWLE